MGESSQLVEGCYLLLISGEGGLLTIVCFQSAWFGEGLFLLCRLPLYLAVSPGWFLALSPGISIVSFGPGYPGCVIKG